MPHAHPDILSANTVAALVNLDRARPAPVRGGGRPAAGGAPFATLSPRCCGFAWTAHLTPGKAPDGLKALLARAGEAPDFSRLEADLAARQAEVASLFNVLVT